MYTFPPIAIVGVAALFAGSSEPDGFWRNILAGTDLITDVPSSHWLIEDYYDADPSAPGKTYSKRGSFLSDVPFDPLANGVTPVNVATTDSAQLLGLVVAKRALEDACGPDLARLDRKRTSVILGVGGATEMISSMAGYLQAPLWARALREAGLPEETIAALCERASAMYAPWNENTFPGMLPNVVAGRIANRFDLGGANFTTDAACASALAAVRMAVHELALGSVDLALTGGVDALNDIVMYMNFSKTPAMSASGVCRPFGDGADGTLMGEGIGMFAMRRLADAERDGDPIYAVLRGIGASSDGRAKSIYAPSSAGQAEALRRAYACAGYGPETVELVEAHGTATPAGDVAEAAGLKAVFSEAKRTDAAWCALGSVKSQIGHTKGAAGAASLYKVVMALHHRVLPATINVVRPNPKLGLDESPFYLNATTRPWVRDREHPRRAAVSSFGFGGSNFHVTVEEYRGANRPERIRTLDAELVLASAATPEALRDDLARLRAATTSRRAFLATARTSQRTFRATDAARLAIVARDEADFGAQADAALAALARDPGVPFAHPNGATYAVGPVEPGAVGFVFPGQGSQYPGMGRDLTLAFDPAADVWDASASDPAPGYRDLARLTFPEAAFDDAARAAQADRLRATEVAQPAIGVTSLAYLRVLEAIGVAPAAVAGHSYGELTALHAAGVVDEAAFRAISRRRGEAMADAAKATPGAMLAVLAPVAQVESIVRTGGDPALVIANYNGPEQVVLSGTVTAIAQAEARFGEHRISVRRLPVATAFHSPIVAAAVAPFSASLAADALAAPRLPVYATATAEPYPAEPGAIRAQLAEQLSRPVRFTAQIEAMYAAGVRTFVEVGPNRTLSSLVGSILADRPHAALALDDRNGGLATFWRALGALALRGVAFDTAPLWERIDLAPPIVEKRTPVTVDINGANYGKPYPRKPGAPVPPPLAAFANVAPEARPAPVLPPLPTAQPARAVVPAPRTTMQPIDDSTTTERLALFRQASEAHLATQRIWADTHQEYLRLAALVAGAESASPEMPLARTPAALVAPPAAVTAAAPAPAPVAPAPAPVAAAPAPVAPAPAPVAPAPVAFAPAPAAVAPAAASGDEAYSRASITALMRDVVAKKTGYPVEMIDLDMELEADLGIDSIKRVEILSAFRKAALHLPEIDPRELAALDTLGAILDRLVPGGSPEGVPAPAAATPASTGVPSLAAAADPVAGAAPAAAAPASTDLAAVLFAVVSAKTGYPVEMLDPDMELEADLGIDSIKRVEILSAFRKAAPNLPDIDPRELASLQTLHEILARLGSAADPATQHQASLAEAPVAAPSVAVADLPVETAVLVRRGLVAVAEPAAGTAVAGFAPDARVAIVGHGGGMREALARELEARGAVVADDGETAVDAVVALSGLHDGTLEPDVLAAYLETLEAAHAFANRPAGARGAFVTVTNLGGDCGLRGAAGDRAWLGGFSAMMKTAAAEWPEAALKAIDLPTATSVAHASWIAAECFTGGDAREVGFGADGVRVVVREVDAPAPPAGGDLPERPVLVVTGGARGILPACLHALVEGLVAPRIAILGRTPLTPENGSSATAVGELPAYVMASAEAEGRALTPLQLGAEVRRIAANREVRESLRALEDAGAEVLYLVADVASAEALESAVQEVRTRFGRIDGIVHGAGVLADKRIAEQTAEQFRTVFATKVAGLRALLAATRNDDLRAIVLFSSVAARYGNAGQVAYGAANEVLNKVARAEALRRGDRCVVRSLNWGPWDGGMVTDGLRALFEARNIPVIPRALGARAFAAEVLAGTNGPDLVDVDVVLAMAPR